MNQVKIITDSCADLNGELLEKYDIDYVKMLTICDGKESPALLTWTPEEIHQFYDAIRDGKRITTAQVKIEEFTSVFKKYLEAGQDIVYVACSSKQSSTVNTGKMVAKNLMNEYPDRKIYCIDSLNSCICEGLLAMAAAKMANEGKSAQEIHDFVVANKKNVREFATVHTLEYLKRAGRVSGASAFFGNLMGIKPILVSDTNGAQAAFKKVKGRQNAIREIVALLKANFIDENETVYVGHADASEEEVAMLVDLVKQEIACKEVCILPIGPIVGASVGPDTLGVFAWGKEETFAAEEK